METDDTELVPSGDACGACLALQGTNAKPPIHPNCLCQAVPREKECEEGARWVSYSPHTKRVHGEVDVTCPDGVVLSESFDEEAPHDWDSLSIDDLLDRLYEFGDEQAEELCDQCPESASPEDKDSPFLCC